MKVIICIEAKHESIFRECVDSIDSMAISNMVSGNSSVNDVVFTLESTCIDDDFINDLFYLGWLFGVKV